MAKGNPSNNAQLLMAVKAAWDNLPYLNITNLIESMPRRCQAVIDAKRGLTRYYGYLAQGHVYNKPDIICISETWLGDDITSECSIPGYHCERCDRHRRGGVLLYVHI